MMTATDLANKRTRKVLRRRTLLKGRRRNRPSAYRGSRRALDAYELAQRMDALKAQQERSEAASAGKRGGFMDGVKSKLFKLLPRRTPVAD
jgi:hypothetical protein